MITIRHGIESGWLTLRMSGHSGIKGESIPCAAVSALAETLALYTLKADGEADAGDGYANIYLRNNRENREVYNAIVDGLKAIADRYSGEVKFS